jgi:hypothetical protein
MTTDRDPDIGWLRRLLIAAGGLDRRWTFLAMGLAIAVPILFELQFPESPKPMARAAFDAIEALPPGSRVVLSFDYDPASEGELQPMANAVVHHCAARGHRMVFMALWPLGKQKADETIKKILLPDRPGLVYGTDYVQLGFMAGNEVVIKGLTGGVEKVFPTDAAGTPLAKLPLVADMKDLQDADLIVSISAGYPGAKEWVQYAKSTYPDAYTLVAGSTGVQSNQLFPYYPNQMEGMLAAVKGAAGYEMLVVEAHPPASAPDRLAEGRRRMGPQFVAHLLMVGLILLGNLSMLASRGTKGGPR